MTATKSRARPKPKATPQVAPAACAHRYITRSGNRHGSFAQCQECLTKWKWNPTHQGWVHFVAASSSSQLPLPSSATVLDDSWISPPENLQAAQTYQQSTTLLESPYMPQDRLLQTGAVPKRRAQPSTMLMDPNMEDTEGYDQPDPLNNVWSLLEPRYEVEDQDAEEYDWEQ